MLLGTGSFIRRSRRQLEINGEYLKLYVIKIMVFYKNATPVLGANIGGIPELIQVGKTGELFESGNAEDLKKIEKLWGDKKLCAEYSANCKDISFDTIDEYYEKIMKVYR